jgi:surfeit locus 1 family protein
MRQVPLLATLVVAAAVATMIGLGVWQLQRAAEKDRLLAEYTQAAALPPLDLDPLLARAGAELPPLAFRRVRVGCRIRGAAPELRGGRSRRGEGGYVHLLRCRPGAPGLAGRLVVNAGWARLPDADRRFTLDSVSVGTLGSVRDEGPVVLTAAEAPPPLEPAAPPRLEDISDNHLAYAFQWFFFAAAAALIYVLALRRRRRGQ